MSTDLNRLLSKPFSRRAFGMGSAAALAATVAPFNIVRAQGGPLKVGILLPKSGVQAQIGQSCQRGIELAPALLKELGYAVNLEFMNADTESNVDVARSRAERLISDGAHLLVGAFDSGQTTAIAQVTEQRRTPFLVNIGAAPQITEQGYQFIARNFLTAPQLVTRGLERVKELLAATGASPKTAVYLHLNDTFGMAVKGAIEKIIPSMNMPFKILDAIAYDPAAKDLSVEVAKAKATQAELLLVTTRLNDAILLVREMVRQRWSPMGIVSPGSPGMYEAAFFSNLGKNAEYCISNVPWYNPKSPMAQQVVAEFKKRFPNDHLDGHIFNVGFTFEAALIAADAYKRAGTTEAVALMKAIRATRIETHVMMGGPIQFDEKGQNNGVASVCLQNRGGRAVVTLPKDAAEMEPVFPVPAWDKRA
jgi:branched-chain amino acid transport system substrate-binding protein